MLYQEVMEALEAVGTAQNRKVYPRHGVRPPLFGVSYANLGKLHKALKKDHGLARQLWASGNHDARVLATMIADPTETTPAELDAWVEDLDNYVLTDAFSKLVAKASESRGRFEAWKDSKKEFVGQAAYDLLCYLAGQGEEHPDSFYEEELRRIEKQIHTRPNRVRHAMNQALISIGIRNDSLQEQALAAASRIGNAEVDHGQTGCKTPDAAAYIEKVLEHRRKKAAEKVAKRGAL